MGKMWAWLLEAIDWYGRWTAIKEIWLILSMPISGVVVMLTLVDGGLPTWAIVLICLNGIVAGPFLYSCYIFFSAGPLRLVPYDGEIIQLNHMDDDGDVLPLHQGNRRAVRISVRNFTSKISLQDLKATITSITPHPHSAEGEKFPLPQRLMLGNKGTAEKVHLDYKEPVAVQLFSITDNFLGYQDLRMENSDKKHFSLKRINYIG